MAFIMNEWDVEDAYNRYVDNPDTPNLGTAADILYTLVGWTNANSDGWPYWGKPSKAADALQRMLDARGYDGRGDVTAEQVRDAVRPVKAFLTRTANEHRERHPEHAASALRFREAIVKATS